MWRSIPTAAGRLKFARGRAKKFALSISDGALVPKPLGAEGHDYHPDGFTALMRSGRKLLGYRFGGYRASFVVTDANGELISRHTRIRNAVPAALGGQRTFVVSDSCAVTIAVEYSASENVAALDVQMHSPNPDAVWDHERRRTMHLATRDEESLALAIGLLNDSTVGDGLMVTALIDKLVERHPETFRHDSTPELVVRHMFSNPVPNERLRKTEFQWLHPGYRSRVVYLTGNPVEGPEGEWLSAGTEKESA